MRATTLVPSRVSWRQIYDDDVASIATLLNKGFPNRSHSYWLEVFDRLAQHIAPPEMPKYGYLIECAGDPVGVILLISTMMQVGGASTLRCNLSSWFVEPNFRCYASWLISQAMREKHATYVNLSPAPHTVPIIEVQGFSRFSSGQFVAPVFPPIRRWSRSVRVVECNVVPDAHFEPFERDLLLAHSRYGCISIWCITSERAYPFVFLPRVVKLVVPCVQLLYCRELDDVIRFAPQIGSYLGRRGKPILLIDSKGPIRGLPGKYFDGASPKYYRGPQPPQTGDLAYTEVAILPRFYPTFFETARRRSR